MGVWTSSSGPEPIHSPAKPPGFTSSSPSAASNCTVRDEVAAAGAGVVMVAGFIAVLSSLSQFADLAQRRLHLELDAHSAVFRGGFRRVA